MNFLKFIIMFMRSCVWRRKLKLAYKMMARDKVREVEANDWVEGVIVDYDSFSK